MMIKSITAGVVASALMSSVAFAQTPSTTTTTDRASSSTMASDSSSHKGEWRTSKLMGLDVYNDNNEKLGDINEVLVDKSGKITAVVIGVGGFLGIGENDVAVSFDKLKFVNEPVAYAAGSGSSNTAGNRPAGNAATGAPMTTTGTSTPSGAATTPAPMTTTGTGTGTGATGSGAAGTSSGMTGSGSASSSSAAASRSNPWYPDHAVLSATKDQLKSMTQFKYSDQ